MSKSIDYIVITSRGRPRTSALEFTSQLPRTLYLNENAEIGVVELFLSMNFPNIPASPIRLFGPAPPHLYVGKDATGNDVVFPGGRFASAAKFLEVINSCAAKITGLSTPVSFMIDAKTNKITMSVGARTDSSVIYATFSKELNEIMGFAQVIYPTVGSPTVQATSDYNIPEIPNHIVLLSNEVSGTIVNDQTLPLVAIVDVSQDKNIVQRPSLLTYKPLKSRSLSQVSLRLQTMDGKVMSWEDVDLTVMFAIRQ
jgi:hypothetical protein